MLNLAEFKRKYEKRFKYLPSTASTTYITDKGDKRRIKVPAAQEILQNARRNLQRPVGYNPDATPKYTKSELKKRKEARTRLKKYTGGETPSDRKQTVRGLNKKQKKVNKSIVLYSPQSSALTTTRPKLESPEYQKIISTKNKTTVNSILSQTSGTLPSPKSKSTPQLLQPAKSKVKTDTFETPKVSAPKTVSTNSTGAKVTVSTSPVKKGLSKNIKCNNLLYIYDFI
jgi:hypothetical protein